MFALFKYTYDYHQFQRLCAVSARKDLLEERYYQIRKDMKWSFPLISAENHAEFKEKEEGHYCIVQIEELK
jgi:hypothetical protein